MKELKPSLLLFLAFSVICGAIYPALVTALAQALFPAQAAGSPASDRSGRTVGSRLIGQSFTDNKYFWPRPSATSDFPYNPMASSGSNAGPTNPEYLKTVADRVRVLRASGIAGPLPADLVQASASGLDPDISPEAATVQVARVARARGLAEAQVARLVADHTKGRQLGFAGEPRINVLELNLALNAQR